MHVSSLAQLAEGRLNSKVPGDRAALGKVLMRNIASPNHLSMRIVQLLCRSTRKKPDSGYMELRDNEGVIVFCCTQRTLFVSRICPCFASLGSFGVMFAQIEHALLWN